MYKYALDIVKPPPQKKKQKQQTNKQIPTNMNHGVSPTPSTNDFDDSPYPYDTPKFRCIFVKRCFIGLVYITYNRLTTFCWQEKLLEKKKSQGVATTPQDKSSSPGLGLRVIGPLYIYDIYL